MYVESYQYGAENNNLFAVKNRKFLITWSLLKPENNKIGGSSVINVITDLLLRYYT